MRKFVRERLLNAAFILTDEFSMIGAETLFNVLSRIKLADEHGGGPMVGDPAARADRRRGAAASHLRHHMNLESFLAKADGAPGGASTMGAGLVRQQDPRRRCRRRTAAR